MTILPFLDVKATPICSVESPRLARTRSVPRSLESTDHSIPSLKPSSSLHLSNSFATTRTPKIKIVARTDEQLKKLPHAKTARAQAHNPIWKPFVRELPDYDYLWEPVHREDIRHQYDSYVAPQHINAGRPDEPYRMSSFFETQDRHYYNYKRVQAMQQRQRNREHMQYTIYPYAQAEEREMYKKKIRTTLKEQMEEKAQAEKHQLDLKNRSTSLVLEQDRQFREEEKQRNDARTQLLAKVSLKNKELMNNRREYDQWNRVHQWHVERAMLADSPINWSKTLT
ncbi:hypothetical protein I4U23_006658 [Adineta vaga]|nr:hypothetical protein I4U23_006658 [Adineta vaga]